MDELVPGNRERKNGIVPGPWYLFGLVLAVIEESCAVLGRPLHPPVPQLFPCKRCIITFVGFVVRRYSFLAENVLTMVYSSVSTSLTFYQIGT